MGLSFEDQKSLYYHFLTPFLPEEKQQNISRSNSNNRLLFEWYNINNVANIIEMGTEKKDEEAFRRRKKKERYSEVYSPLPLSYKGASEISTLP